MFALGVSSGRTPNAAIRSRDGSRVLVYLSSPTTVFLQLDKVEAKQVRVTWISPVTGERGDAGTYETGNLTGSTFPLAPTQFFKTPSSGSRVEASSPVQRFTGRPARPARDGVAR